MRRTVIELKRWLDTMEDDALISVDKYTNKKTKEMIIASAWRDNAFRETEYIVAELDNEDDL